MSCGFVELVFALAVMQLVIVLDHSPENFSDKVRRAHQALWREPQVLIRSNVDKIAALQVGPVVIVNDARVDLLIVQDLVINHLVTTARSIMAMIASIAIMAHVVEVTLMSVGTIVVPVALVFHLFVPCSSLVSIRLVTHASSSIVWSRPAVIIAKGDWLTKMVVETLHVLISLVLELLIALSEIVATIGTLVVSVESIILMV